MNCEAPDRDWASEYKLKVGRSDHWLAAQHFIEPDQVEEESLTKLHFKKGCSIQICDGFELCQTASKNRSAVE